MYTVYPKKYAHGFCFAVLCCGCTLTDFPISIRLTSLALWQSIDCPSASKATLMNMDKYMWIHYERLHNHNKAKQNKTVYIFLGIYCRCVLQTSTPECVVSPRQAITRQHKRELMSTTHTYPWIIPIITWCRQFFSLPTNILLIKSRSKLESRATAVSVAMSPRNLGGNYRCRPHPRSRKCTRQFFVGSRAWSSNCSRVASSLDNSVVDHVVSLKVEILSHTVLSNETVEFYKTMIYPYLNRSVCLLMGLPIWWRFSSCLSSSSLVFWWRDAPLMHEFQMWDHWCKQWVSRWFQGHKMRFRGIWSITSS